MWCPQSGKARPAGREGSLGAGALLLSLLAAVACRDARLSAPPEPIVIAAAMLPHAALVHVAAARGYFAAEGLEAALQPHRFGKPALDAVLAGKADLATVAETPVVFAALRGARLSVYATISTATANTALVARRAAGIAAPRDLMGKRVGVARATNGEFFLDTLLVRNGVPRGSVRPVDLAPDAMPGALERGEVDAVAIWNPTSAELQRRLGAEVQTFFADDVYLETFNVVGSRDFARRRPAGLAKVLRALLRAEALVREAPGEARGALASIVPPEDAERIWRVFDFQVRLEQSLVLLMEEEARWAIRAGLVAKQDMPDFPAVIEPEPLASLRPEAVRLLQ